MNKEAYLRAFEKEFEKIAVGAGFLKAIKDFGPKVLKWLKGGGKQIAGMGTSLPGMWNWWRKGVGLGRFKAGYQTAKTLAKQYPRGVGLLAGAGGAGLATHGLAAYTGGRLMNRQASVNPTIMNKEAYVKGFEEELEKIAKGLADYDPKTWSWMKSGKGWGYRKAKQKVVDEHTAVQVLEWARDRAFNAPKPAIRNALFGVIKYLKEQGYDIKKLEKKMSAKPKWYRGTIT